MPIRTTKQTSPQGVVIEMIEPPASMRPSFSNVSADGLVVTPVKAEDLTETERNAFNCYLRRFPRGAE